MWDDLLRMEGSWSMGWQYHLCILHRWTIRHYIALQRSAIVSQQDWARGRDAIDKNGLVIIMRIRLKITSSSGNQTLSLMFCSSSRRAQLGKTPTHSHTHTWRQHKMTCVNTAEYFSLSSSSSSFKVCVSSVLLVVAFSLWHMGTYSKTPHNLLVCVHLMHPRVQSAHFCDRLSLPSE